MCSTVTVFDGMHGQDLCQGASRCPLAVINKCTSIIAATNNAGGSKNQLCPDSASVAPGTGIFFSHAFTSECDNSPDICITRLAHLAMVACNFEDMQSQLPGSRRLSAILKPGKATLKKRRTPRPIQLKTFETLHIPELEMSTAGPWSTLNVVYNATHLQRQTCQQNQEHSDDRSKSPRMTGECLSIVSSEMMSSSGGPSSSSLTGGNQCTLSLSAGPSGSPSAAKKGRRKPETRVERYARTILKFVGDGSVPEKLIRLTLGNNPDTSKALRLLLAHRKLKRLGEGGKGSAYLYLATPIGLKEIEQMTAQDQALCLVQEEHVIAQA